MKTFYALFASIVMLPNCLNASVSVLPVHPAGYRSGSAILYYGEEVAPYLEWSVVLFFDESSTPSKLILFSGATTDTVKSKLSGYDVRLSTEVYSQGSVSMYTTRTVRLELPGVMWVSLQFLHDKSAEELKQYMSENYRNLIIDPAVSVFVKANWSSIVDTLNTLSADDKDVIQLSKTSSPSPARKPSPEPAVTTPTAPLPPPAPAHATSPKPTEAVTAQEKLSAHLANDPEIKFFRRILDALKFSNENIEQYFTQNFDWIELTGDWKKRILYLRDKMFSSPEMQAARPPVDTSHYEILYALAETLRNSSDSIAGLYKTFKNVLTGHPAIIQWLLNETDDKIILFGGDDYYAEWGVYEGHAGPDSSPTGKNYFGFMLMMLRDELRRENTKIHSALGAFDNDLRTLGNAVRSK